MGRAIPRVRPTLPRYPLRSARFRQLSHAAGEYAHHDDLHALLETLGVARAHVVGISFGGFIAVDFALTYPESVTALVPVAAGVGGIEDSDDLQRQLAEVDEIAAREGIDAANERELCIWVDGPKRAPEQTNPTLRERMRQLNRDQWAQERPGTARYLSPPAAERLGEIRVPTLVIYGDGDVSDMIAIGEHLAASVPGARREVFPGVAHMVNMERPDEFSRAVIEFLRSMRPPL